MKRSFWFRKIAGFILVGVAAVFLFSLIVMSLWNNILTSVLSVPAISFGQALGILILSKILFGGFKGGGGWRGRGGHWGQQMKDKWQTMTPEEQQKFKSEWRSRCNRWGRSSDAEVSEVKKDIK